MFHRRTDASKVALVGLVDLLREDGEGGACSTSSGPPTTSAPSARSSTRSPPYLELLSITGRRAPPTPLGLRDGWFGPCGGRGRSWGHDGAPRAAGPAVDDPHLLGALDGQGQQRAVPQQPGQGADRAVDRLRPPDPDGLRPGPRPRPRRGGQGGRARRPPRSHAGAARRHPPGRDEHVDDDQRDGSVAARSVRRERRGPRRRPRGPPRHDAERHRQGVPVPRHVHLPAAPVAPAHRRHDGVLRGARAAVEPDERLQLPPAGGGGDAHAGAGLQPRHGHRRARRGARVRPGRRGPVPAGVRVDQLLREQRHPLRRGDGEDARLHAAVGPHRARALRRHRPEGAALPLRRAGQQPRPHRGAAREQRAAHRPRDARRHALPRRRGRGRSSSPRGTRRWGCRGRGTSSGPCGCSRCSPTRPTCSSTPTCSRGRS